MDALDYWRLCDELSVVQAALLIVGKDPSGLQAIIDSQAPSDMPSGYAAAKSALINAIRSKQLRANIVETGDEDFTAPDWHYTAVNVGDLKLWLSLRGFESGFSFPWPSAARIICRLTTRTIRRSSLPPPMHGWPYRRTQNYGAVSL
jgi:hypothetical protein